MATADTDPNVDADSNDNDSPKYTIDDSELAIPIFSPVCTWCAHWLDTAGGRQCAAYPAPNSIPMQVWMGAHLHMTPRGDEHRDIATRHPIVFAPAAGAKLPAGLRKAYETAHQSE